MLRPRRPTKTADEQGSHRTRYAPHGTEYLMEPPRFHRKWLEPNRTLLLPGLGRKGTDTGRRHPISCRPAGSRLADRPRARQGQHATDRVEQRFFRVWFVFFFVCVE